MHLSHSVEIDAPTDAVWAVLADVERWPEWTPTMRRVELLDARGLGPDVRARIWQPRAPANVWRVTAFEPGRGFSWEARAFGATMAAGHTVEPSGAGSRVTLTIDTRGPLAILADPLLGWISRRWVPQEAAGLKRRLESGGV